VLVMLALVLRVDYEGRDPLSGVRA
jgi:hypothetical protein